MTVHLVGAGPGGADLLTLRAARLLVTADVIVADRLADDEVKALIPASTPVLDVGKTPGGPTTPQSEINDLLVALGRRHSAVVRLKGGDPLLFGRGLEEAAALRLAGVDVEIVPGISSSLAAPLAAGVAVTERNVASGVSIVTAHQDAGSEPLDWHALATSGTTLVVLMGARRAGEIREHLLGAGREPSTPVAIVTDAYRPTQTTWFGPLADLGVAPVRAPSVIVIGEVTDSVRHHLVRTGLDETNRSTTSAVFAGVPAAG